MATSAEELALEIRSWPDLEKLRLVNAILSDLDKPDPELDRIWAEKLEGDGRLIKPVEFLLCPTTR